MRTDLFNAPALLLAGALLAAGPGLAAQDTVAPPAEAAAAVVRSPDRIALNGDVVIGPNEVVEGRVVVMKGDLRVEGRVTGDVTVAKGDLLVAPGAEVGGRASVTGGSLTNRGRIAGDAEVTGGTLVNHGRIAGEMRVESERSARAARAEARARAEAAARLHGGWLGSFGQGLEEILSTLSLGLVLAGLGAGAVFYGYPRVQMASDVLRADPLKAGGAGLAGAVLVVPVLLVMVFALVVTIIGIPLVPVAVPLYVLAAAAVLGFGLVAAAHALGERTAEQRGLLAPAHRNGYTYVFTGLAILLAPVVLANLLQMSGLGLIGGILEFFAWAFVWGAALVGAGSVLMTRGGLRRPAERRPYDPIFDNDPVFDVGGSHA